jgi:ElaB/YqjD/DUF883 family membrane-anchored ribosome-binding protein
MSTDTFSDASQDAASQVKSAAADVGQAAAAKVDNKRGAAASTIDAAAARLDSGGQRVASMAHGAADKLNSTADYIRENDLNAMAADVKTLVKNNPVPALLGAAALGFVLAKAFSSRD